MSTLRLFAVLILSTFISLFTQPAFAESTGGGYPINSSVHSTAESTTCENEECSWFEQIWHMFEEWVESGNDS